MSPSTHPATTKLYDRTPPQSIEAERASLGCIFLNSKDSIAKVVEILGEDPEYAFYLEAHQHIYGAVLALSRKGAPVDTTTVTEHMSAAGNLEAGGGALYIAELTGAVPTSANADYYAGIVAGTAILRAIISACTRAVHEAYSTEAGLTPEEVLDFAESQLSGLGTRRSRNNLFHISDFIDEAADELRFMAENPGKLLGVPMGVPAIDRITGGFQDGDLIILGARTSTGKSAFAMQVAHGASQVRPVIFLSLEMNRKQLGQRAIYLHGGVSRHSLREGFNLKAELEKVEKARNELKQRPMWFVECSTLSTFEVRSRLRSFFAKHGTCIIIVDYLQLVMASGKHKERRLEVAEISRNLKAIARELNVPVVALSQTSRASDAERAPRLSDLSEAAAIEQDADVVILLSRLPKKDEKEFLQKNNWSLPTHAQVVVADVAKQRNLPTDTVTLCFDRNHQRFESRPGESKDTGVPLVRQPTLYPFDEFTSPPPEDDEDEFMF